MDDTEKKILRAVEKMPAFPKSVRQVLALASDTGSSPSDLVDVIKHDPIFTLRILKVVNSPFIGLRRQITSIHQAGVYLGLNTLKNIALGLAAIGILPRKNKADFDMNNFWLHSIAVAIVSRKLGELMMIGDEEREDYFSAGLLHDIGKGVLAMYFPEEFRRALGKTRRSEMHLFEAEREIMGMDHAVIGSMLAEKWALPQTLVDCIKLHHAGEHGPEPGIVNCVIAANQICKIMKYGFAGNYRIDDLPSSILCRFSGDAESIARSMPSLSREFEEASIFAQV